MYSLPKTRLSGGASPPGIINKSASSHACERIRFAVLLRIARTRASYFFGLELARFRVPANFARTRASYSFYPASLARTRASSFQLVLGRRRLRSYACVQRMAIWAVRLFRSHACVLLFGVNCAFTKSPARVRAIKKYIPRALARVRVAIT